LTAVIFSEKVTRIFDKNLFGHGQSYSGHALACAAALRSIEVLEEENLIQRSQELGAYLGERLTEMAKRHKLVGDVRGLGLFWTVELVKNRQTKEPFRRFTEKYKETVVTKIAQYLPIYRAISSASGSCHRWL